MFMLDAVVHTGIGMMGSDWLCGTRDDCRNPEQQYPNCAYTQSAINTIVRCHPSFRA